PGGADELDPRGVDLVALALPGRVDEGALDRDGRAGREMASDGVVALRLRVCDDLDARETGAVRDAEEQDAPRVTQRAKPAAHSPRAPGRRPRDQPANRLPVHRPTLPGGRAYHRPAIVARPRKQAAHADPMVPRTHESRAAP